jgi:hypothetical protein
MRDASRRATLIRAVRCQAQKLLQHTEQALLRMTWDRW